MATSLSRQLEQLRTSAPVESSQSKDGGSTVSSLGPNIINVHLTSEELDVLSKEAIQELTIVCPVFRDYQNLLFPDDDDRMAIDDDAPSRTLEDLLFLLTPHLSRPAAQYILQLLVTKHKVHVNYPETLLFSVIPYFEKTLFNRVVEALPVRFGKARAEEEFPRWVENFKAACHPATKVGIVRHLASDQGFFKLFCHMYVHKLLRNHIQK